MTVTFFMEFIIIISRQYREINSLLEGRHRMEYGGERVEYGEPAAGEWVDVTMHTSVHGTMASVTKT
jgi:hypothetical protein